MQHTRSGSQIRSKTEARQLLDNPETIRSFLRHIPSKRCGATFVEDVDTPPAPKAETVIAEPSASYPTSPINPETKLTGGQLHVAGNPIYVRRDSFKAAVYQKAAIVKQSEEPQRE
jgi:hypothetical protein